MKLLSVDTIDEAREKIVDRVKSWSLKTKTISLDDVCGLSDAPVLAEDLYAACDIPGFSRSTVDGYAVKAADTAGAGEAIPVFLKQAGSVSMGEPADFSIGPGECAYVPTGAMLPAGADAVVMVEYSEAAGETIALYEAAAPGTGMAEAGEDIRKGELLLRRGTQIGAQEAGALAAAGKTIVPVFIPLTLSIISTGDELISPERDPCPGQIRDINTYMLKALAKKRAYQVVSIQVICDDQSQLETAVKEAMATCDVVAVSGGSSQGEKDLTAQIINRVANPGVFTHGLAVKPGKPTILGWDEESKTLLAGLPGHPVSAMMIFQILFGSLQDIIFSKTPHNFPVPARISSNIPGSPGRTVLLPVILRLNGNSYLAEPVFGKSGMITTMTQADGYIIIDRNKEGLCKEEEVLVYLL
jgi:molybdopterin molybdotransferase